MTSKTRQDWNIGATVKVGFLTLVVKSKLPNSEHLLTNVAGTKLYHQTPYNGVLSVDLLEARELLAASAWAAKTEAERLIERARIDAAAVVAINDMLFSAVAA
jgi:hypothetical protein